MLVGIGRLPGRISSAYGEDDVSEPGIHERVGTPFYMAPEQRRGEPADERSDQFSFCVALQAALARSDRPAPPAWLRRVLERGLAADPAARHPSMPALLTELERGLSRRPGRVLLVAAGLLALGLAVVAGRLWLAAEQADPALACQREAEVWRGVWDPVRRAEIEAGFLASGKPFAAQSFAEVARQLDAHTAAWTAMASESCTATRVHTVQPEALYERRLLCLDSRRRETAALADLLAAADARTVENAGLAVGRLAELGSCADLTALASQVKPPASAGQRARVAELDTRLAAISAARLAGGDGRGRASAEALVAEARAVAYRPLEARALFELGWLADQAGDYAAAAGHFEAAVWAAEAGGDDEQAARAWGMWMMTLGQRLARVDDALALRPRITALLERLGRRPDLEAMLHASSASILYLGDRFAEARVEAEQALAQFEQHFGADDLHVAEPLILLGDLARQKDPAAGRALYERAVAVRKKAYGPDHPHVARGVDRVASTYWLEGRIDEAIAASQQVIATYERALGPDHPDVAKATSNLAMLYRSAGDGANALAASQRALDITGRALGREHADYGSALTVLGENLEQLGRHDEALAALDKARVILEKALGAEHSSLADTHVSIAQVHYFSRRYPEARRAAERALAIREQAFGPRATDLREPLLFIAWSDLELGAPARAAAGLERAYRLREGAGPCFFANIEFGLARALWASGGDRQRAVGLAREARSHMADDCGMAEERREVTRWLARNAG
jgi:tetratricopeptide (TPR) repeat protein